MEPQIESHSSSRFDAALLAVAAVLLVGGMTAFYYFGTELNVLVRTLILLGATAAAIACAYRTQLGKELWGYALGARGELRKVVWPSRQESLQATLMIAVVVLIMSLLLWGLDSLLLYLVKLVTGRG